MDDVFDGGLITKIRGFIGVIKIEMLRRKATPYLFASDIKSG